MSNKLKALVNAIKAEAAKDGASDSVKELGATAEKLFDELTERPLFEHRIHGHMFRISSPNAEEYAERVADFRDHVTSDFKRAYENHYGAMHSIAESAKVYLEKNWSKVKDWTNLGISIIDNTGDRTEYYNHKPKEHLHELQDKEEASILDRAFLQLDDYCKGKHNPVNELSEMVLDHSDGDFSVCINGHWHNWIDDASVIMLADYVEKQLAQKVATSDTA